MALQSTNVASWIKLLFTGRRHPTLVVAFGSNYSSMYVSTFKSFLWISIIGYTVGVERSMYGECVKTCGKAPPLRVYNMERRCIIGADNCSYCKYFGCPPVECFKKGKLVVPNITPNRLCFTCDDQCVYGNDIRKKGDKFMAFDDVNSCECKNTGRIVCSKKKRKPIPRDFCDA